uniref:Uncharacterized protein n=1 Tax=Rhizophora mucronata TaxID=61149 RepID=A0A2P2QGN2_RHIMU
MFGCARREPK